MDEGLSMQAKEWFERGQRDLEVLAGCWQLEAIQG